MRIFNHTSRVVTVKSTAFEDSIGMEKSIEISDDRFDFALRCLIQSPAKLQRNFA